MELAFDGETALVTAASSGLGKASAASLAREGADVVICSRSEEKLEAAAVEIRADAAGEVVPVVADITDPDDVAAVVETTVESFGGLDHVVTSAGGPPSGPFDDTPERAWYEAYDLLVMSVVWTVRAARPHLVESDTGTVTCITSKSVKEPVDGLVLSNAVRRGVVGLVKTLSREWAPDVRVNTVLPGTHETPRVTELVEQGVERGEYSTYDEGISDWADTIPMGGLGDPSAFGDVVAFVASERASFVNGASIPVDGGETRS
ncbi:SDR family oxidoreductase [Halocalculus aciditolerans]|uniref:Oxidoreductase n=1 Tax=Halocalculus aciditolerans TaxID=1383812 RepID=A0A830FFX2_9EURY|nr:SDR family oxidoreductase [Halocalculus aciditolerans]GGL49237.1 oxidoreductase [Halocalculus aciditolerans]